MTLVTTVLIASTLAGLIAALNGNLRYDKRLIFDDLLSGAVLGLAVGAFVVCVTLALMLAWRMTWGASVLRPVVMT
jgi:hypothetical protein